MDDNPYKSPVASGAAQPKLPYTRFWLIVDMLCIVAPLAPIALRIAVQGFDLPAPPTVAGKMEGQADD